MGEWKFTDFRSIILMQWGYSYVILYNRRVRLATWIISIKLQAQPVKY